jgi:malonyl-CoA decarboxylase
MRFSRKPYDPVARFHLGNATRLEQVDSLGNTARRAIEKAFGIMANYLYDNKSVTDNRAIKTIPPSSRSKEETS